MKRIFAAVVTAWALVAGAADDQGVTFRLERVTAAQLAKIILGDVARVPYVVEDDVAQKTVTFHGENMERGAIVDTLRDVLAVQGVSIVKRGGVDFDDLAKRVREKSGVDPRTGKYLVEIDAELIVLGVVAKMVILAGRKARQEAKESEKLLKRRAQLRKASRDFRAARGHRLVYVPVGG